jgi:outer membrane phospholipase A
MSERGEARRIGATQHKNSGRGNKKGDATWNNYVVDFKEYSKSFSLSQEVWAKAVTDCMKVDKTKSPAIIVVLGEGSRKVRLAVIELDELERLIEKDGT